MPRNPVRWGLGLAGLGEHPGRRLEALWPRGLLQALGSQLVPCIGWAEGSFQHRGGGARPIPLPWLANAFRPHPTPPPAPFSHFLFEIWEVQEGIFNSAPSALSQLPLHSCRK